MDRHYKEYMIKLIRYGIVLVLVLMFLGVWFHFSFSFTHTYDYFFSFLMFDVYFFNVG